MRLLFFIPVDGSERQDKLSLQTEIDFDEHDAQVFTYTTPRTALRNRISKSIQRRRKGDLVTTRKSSPDMFSATGKPELKSQDSWGDSQHDTSQPPLVRALSECEDIRLGSSVGENTIFIEGETTFFFNPTICTKIALLLFLIKEKGFELRILKENFIAYIQSNAIAAVETP